MIRRIDPIFGLQTPILFAHRGGAREAPESTEAGFRHAIACQTDVFELDVQLTSDEEMVVWHGPRLDNVRLEIDDVSPGPRTRHHIGDYTWDELKDKAWVMHPANGEDLTNVPKTRDRLLLRLQEFMELFPDAKLNIEMKESFTTRHLERFVEILNSRNPKRVGVVASNRDEHLLQAFRDRTGEAFATNLPLMLLLEDRLESAFGLLHQSLQKRAVELPHPELLSPHRLIRDVREAGGSSYIFLTAIPLVNALDEGIPQREAIFEILDRGVDGIMTDRPASVRPIMDDWIGRNPV